MSYFDIERLGWEEGDQIAGLTIVGDDKRQPYSIRVTCDAEPRPDQQEEEEIEDVLDAVATQELQPVGPLRIELTAGHPLTVPSCRTRARPSPGGLLINRQGQTGRQIPGRRSRVKNGATRCAAAHVCRHARRRARRGARTE